MNLRIPTHFFGNDLATFPNFPAEIRAPLGTVAGVSGFQMKFGSTEVFTPGDQADVMVAMNSAGLKSSLHNVRRDGLVIINTSGFDRKKSKACQLRNQPIRRRYPKKLSSFSNGHY